LTYRDFEDELLLAIHGLEGIENWRKLVGVELDYMKASAESVLYAS
jgi:hypothetical protein